MGEELEEIEKKLEELEKKKAELYKQRQMLFIKLKSAITLLGQYVEFAEKQDIDIIHETNLWDEIKQASKEISVILGLQELPYHYGEKMASIKEIEDEIKVVAETIDRKTRDKAFIIKRGKSDVLPELP